MPSSRLCVRYAQRAILRLLTTGTRIADSGGPYIFRMRAGIRVPGAAEMSTAV